jgi:hypothetical protein
MFQINKTEKIEVVTNCDHLNLRKDHAGSVRDVLKLYFIRRVENV